MERGEEAQRGRALSYKAEKIEFLLSGGRGGGRRETGSRALPLWSQHLGFMGQMVCVCWGGGIYNSKQTELRSLKRQGLG